MAVNSANDLYLAASVRELDRLAIEEHHIPGFTLMKRAGHAVFSALLGKWPATKHIICFCGSGNNAGDGYVVAALAAEKGINTTVVALGNSDSLSGDARLAYDMAAEKRSILSYMTSWIPEHYFLIQKIRALLLMPCWELA